jgi:hypothetical protein
MEKLKDFQFLQLSLWYDALLPTTKIIVVGQHLIQLTNVPLGALLQGRLTQEADR